MLVWAIIVYDEIEYLQTTVKRLQELERPIYVMCDVNSPEAVKSFLQEANIEHSEYAFDGDYSKMRNELDDRVRLLNQYQWICQLDADELPAENLVLEVEDILAGAGVTKVNVCRFNCYSEQLDELDVMAIFESVKTGEIYQMERLWNVEPIEMCKRLYRLDAGIKWHGRIHEWPEGDDDEWADLPIEADFCLWHEKTQERQEMQNAKYEEYEEHRELAAQIAEQMAWKQSIRESLE